MILIADDDPVFLGRAEEVLTANDERVLCAPNVNRAVDLIKHIGSEFGLALIDLDLPDGSGFDLISQIRKLDANLPLIAISAVSSDATLQSSILVGAKGALRKPINDEWGAAINRLRRYKPQDPMKN
jgi:DNA-binding response OmpR family regulator